MAPIMGQFHAERPQSAAESIAGGHFRSGAQRRCDVDDQAHPAAAMIDDGDAVIIAKRSGEADDPCRWDDDLGAAAGGEGEAARFDPAWADFAETLDDWGIGWEPIGELRLGPWSLGRPRPRRSGPEPGEL